MPSPSSLRRKRWSLLAAATVVPLLATGLTALQTPAQAQKPQAKPRTASTHKVTLITGDVVTVTTSADGEQDAVVDRPVHAVGRVRMQEHRGDLYVLPDEAVSLIAANKLDRRLFNVTDLIEMGYDDAHASGVPVIATYAPTKSKAAPAAPRGSKLSRALPSIHGAALKADKKQARTFWDAITPAASAQQTLGAGVAKLWLDGRVTVNLAESVPMVGAPQAWDLGFNGAGVKVAVLDTGIDPTHPDLATQIDDKVSFVPGEDTSDLNGHGTHVASTIVGTGAASGGANKGVAPGADLIVGKVLNNDGTALNSWIIEGMQWAAESGADVISMSLGDSSLTDGTDPMSLAVDQLSAQYDTLFVIAAGNAGPQSIGSPGTAPSALTVGAVDKGDNLAWFSSTGPLLASGTVKPDMTAPGVAINAARSQQQSPAQGDGMYWSIDGTSMATPHISGAAAILKQRHPEWSGQRIKEALVSNAKPLADWYSPFEVGTGRLDIPAALTGTVQTSGALSFGLYDWPHEPTDAPVTKTITYRNSGTADVTLNLGLTAQAPFTLNTTSVTVPAGGTADATVTGDPTAVDYGTFAGYVVATDATSGTAVARTSVGLVKEDERYNLTITLKDRAGNPTAGRAVVNKSDDWYPMVVDVDADGETTVRVRAGEYAVYTTMDFQGERGPDALATADLVVPGIVMNQAREVELDASRARLLDIAAPQRTEDRSRIVDYEIGFSDGQSARITDVIPVWYDEVYVSPVAQPAQGSFHLAATWRQAEPNVRLSLLGGLVPVPVTLQPGSPLTAGTDKLATVYAGSGTAADYAGLKASGKVAVVKRTDDVTPDERAAAAAAAGVKMLVVVNDGLGVLNEVYLDTTVPVVSVHHGAGTLLAAAAAKGLKLTVTRVPYATYLYDFSRDFVGSVPDSPLVYHPAPAELAKIDARYHSPSKKQWEGGGIRADMTMGPRRVFSQREFFPMTRTEWVTPGTAWHETHSQGEWEDRAFLDSYAAGTTTRLNWFAPAAHPSFGEGYSVRNSRWQDSMTLNVQAWTPAGQAVDHGGSLGWGTHPEHLALYQGDTLISEDDHGDMQWFDVPTGTKDYRLVYDAERDAAEWRLSTRTHTEWGFTSGTVDSDWFEPMSLLELDYLLDTDLSGDVPGGSTQRISLVAGAQRGGGEAAVGTVTEITLDVSYDDGATWQKVTLTRQGDGSWAGDLRLPRKAGFVSIRGSAETSTGYTIKQEVIRAYGIR
ncbi:MAG: S8 family serine peptidase [Hamadaea sp.]|nr:S8 family serine peptidase [Hamadaea sp.]